MRNKILFIVVALLLTATGRVWAQTTEDETTTPTLTAYAVYCEGDGSLHFLCSDEELIAGGTFQTDKGETLTITNVWSGTAVTATGNWEPGWASYDMAPNITKVVFEESFKGARPKSCCYWFSGCGNLVTIEGIENLNTSEVTIMVNMFCRCSSLTSLDLSSFDTSNVTVMTNMFSGCSNLTSITLGENFDTSNVTIMLSMFNGCSSLTSLDLSGFDTSNVTSMYYMFCDCSSLTSLDLSNFNTSNVKNMYYMFNGCSNLTYLDLSNFNNASVTNMTDMFYGCDDLKLLDLSNAKSYKEDGEPCDFDFSTLEGLIPTGALTYVPAGTAVTEGRENVVVGDECASLLIGSSQGTLYIPTGFTASKITIDRQFTAGKPHTLYLPFAMDATAYGKFYTCTGYDEVDGTVTFDKTEDAATTANTPYLFVPNEDGINEDGTIVIEPEDGSGIAVTANTDLASAEPEEYGLVGVYEKKTFTAEEASENIYYGWAGGEFVRAGEGASVDACRAYLKLPAEAASTAAARLQVRLGDATGIATVTKDSGNDAPAYNLNGQRVGNSYRGLVIKNGKKVIVR